MDIAAIYGGAAGLLTGGLGGWIVSVYQIRKQSEHNENVLRLEREKFEHARSADKIAEQEHRMLLEADVKRHKRASLLKAREMANQFVEARNRLQDVNDALSREEPTPNLVGSLVQATTSVGQLSQPFYDLALELNGLGYEGLANSLAGMHSELIDLSQFLNLEEAVSTGSAEAMKVPLNADRKTDVLPFDRARTSTTRAVTAALESLV